MKEIATITLFVSLLLLNGQKTYAGFSYEKRLEVTINSGDLKGFKSIIKEIKKQNLSARQFRIDRKNLMEYIVYCGQPDIAEYFVKEYFNKLSKKDQEVKKIYYLEEANKQEQKVNDFKLFVKNYILRLENAKKFFSDSIRRSDDGSFELNYKTNGNVWLNYSYRIPSYLLNPSKKKAELIVRKKANNHVLDNYRSLSSMQESLTDLSRIHKMIYQDEAPLNLANNTIKNQFLKSANLKYDNILSSLVQENYTFLQSLTVIGDIEKLNNEFNVLHETYNKFKKNQITIDLFDSFKQRKTDIIVNGSSVILTQLKSINSLKELTDREILYLENTNSTNEIEQISSSFDEKRNEILAAERLANRKRIRKELEANRKINIEKYGMFLDTSSVKMKKLYLDIYKGNFDEIPTNVINDNLVFGNLINTLLYTKANYCKYIAPNPNHIEMTRNRCIKERIVKNGWGIEIRRDCLESIREGTGLYANPSLISTAGNSSYKQVFGFFGMLLGTNKLSNKRMNLNSTIIEDTKILIINNGCRSKALERFEENLIRLANKESPIVLMELEQANTDRE